MSRRCILPSVAALFLVSCAPSPTRIALTIEYDDAWGINLMEVRGAAHEGERDVQLPAQHSLEIWVPDVWAGEGVRIHIRGLRGPNDAIATGNGTVIPIRGATTSLTIALHRVACGAWCTEGETRCFGDAVAVCEQRDSDECMEWSTPIPCPAFDRFCSLGQCGPACIHECAEGEQRCDGPGGYQLCGNFDGDPCREWSTTTTCDDDQSCHRGTCITGACQNQCAAGATECHGSSVVVCGDLNDDGCTEWGPAMPCASMSCHAGQCVEACADECSVDVCASNVFHECGQFDLDPCLDRSPGLSCTPADPCREGACSDTTGCTTTARICDDPPAQTCTDTDTLRVYDAVGECTAGDCHYAPRDITCANCPACDACATVTCNMPPAATCVDANTLRTYAPNGTCTLGTCTYTPTDTPCFLGCTAGRCAAGGRTFEAYLKASNTGAGDWFGSSVSLSGDVLAVGAPYENSSNSGASDEQLDSGAVYVFRRSTTGAWAQEAYLKASNSDAEDAFGAAVSLSGDLLAVGAPREDSASTGVNGHQTDNSASDSGAVYVFRRNASGAWVQEAYIKASNTSAGDYFGVVSLSQDLLAVGSAYEDSASVGVGGDQTDDSARDAGAVYVFRRSTSGTWTQEVYLKASNPDVDDEFGSSVSLSGSLLAVGADGEASSAPGVNGVETDNSVRQSGAVYVFRRSVTGTWTQEAYLKASNPETYDGFGSSISLSGDLLAVGAFGEDSSATGVGGEQADDAAEDSGAVYVFRRSATGTWAQEIYLKASNTDAGDYFGASVSLYADLLAVGAYIEASSATGLNGDQNNNSASYSGAVYVYRRSATGTWSQETYIKAPNASELDSFGLSVSVFESVLAVGAPWESSAATGVNGDQTNDDAPHSGAVYISR